MDFAQVVRELWIRRWWVFLGVFASLFIGLSTAYNVGLFPPSVQKKALAMGAADTQVLIDTPHSALTDLGINTEPLAQRASVYSRLMTSEPVRAAIAREVGLKPEQLTTESPLLSGMPKSAQEPVQSQRANDLLGEQIPYHLRFSADSGLPAINIQATAPRVEDAIRLANGAASGFTKYIQAVQATQNVPKLRRVTPRQLGRAEGGQVVQNPNIALATVATIALFIGWCLLVLFIGNTVRGLRELNNADQRPLQDAV
jgi:hypothetical protein